jgi:GTPase SAR1 family protein
VTFVELNTNVRTELVIAIAANKSDLVERRAVDTEQAKEYATSIDALFFETSAKDDKGIESLFLTIARKLIENHASKENGTATVVHHDAINLDKESAKKKKGCCG